MDRDDILAPARTDAFPWLSPGDLLALFGSGAVVLLIVTEPGTAPRFDPSLRRFVASCKDIAIGQIGSSELDPTSLWFRMFAAPRLRKIGMPVDRVVPGYYLFRYDLLLGWCPPHEPAGLQFAELAGLDR